MPIGLIVSTLLPIILSMLGSSLATFRALPHANQVERLKAALSSNAFWAAGPVTVAAARTAARSDAVLNALVAAIGMGGGTALAAAGAAATAKYGVKTNGVHTVKKRKKNCGGGCGCAPCQSRANPTAMAFRNRAIRNHHIRIGGTFYTPGGRKGTVLAESPGYYRVRWSDGTLGSVQDSEMTAYPTEGSRANPARRNPAHSLFSPVLLTFESTGTFEGGTSWWIKAGTEVIGELSRQRPLGRSGLQQFRRQASLPYEWDAEIDGTHLTIPDGATLTEAKKIVIAAYSAALRNPNGAIPAALRRRF